MDKYRRIKLPKWGKSIPIEVDYFGNKYFVDPVYEDRIKITKKLEKYLI